MLPLGYYPYLYLPLYTPQIHKDKRLIKIGAYIRDYRDSVYDYVLTTGRRSLLEGVYYL